MSIYFSDAADGEVFGASNTGWGDVCRFVESKASGLPFLVHLTNEGWVAPPSDLRREIRRAIEIRGIPDDVRTVLETLGTFTKNASEIILAGDGLSVLDETTSTKTLPQPTVGVTLEPWSEAELNERAASFTAEDVEDALASRAPEMRAILEAQSED